MKLQRERVLGPASEGMTEKQDYKAGIHSRLADVPGGTSKGTYVS